MHKVVQSFRSTIRSTASTGVAAQVGGSQRLLLTRCSVALVHLTADLECLSLASYAPSRRPGAQPQAAGRDEC